VERINLEETNVRRGVSSVEIETWFNLRIGRNFFAGNGDQQKFYRSRVPLERTRGSPINQTPLKGRKEGKDDEPSGD